MDLTRGVNPFDIHPGAWHGQWLSLDGTQAGPFDRSEVAEVIGSGRDGDEWDGEVAAVLRLNDGRYVSYETFYGPTGNGFCEDAYGGDADVKFAGDLDTIVRFGLTQHGRTLCGLTLTDA